MEEQLPVPISELIVLHLYLSSITLILGIIAIYLLMKFKHSFHWKRFLMYSMLLIILGSIASFLIWVKWPFEFDYMLGPINIPTLLAVIVLVMMMSDVFNKSKIN